jgi:sigma-B regulation protein RsbU (phosphoserine phosphatase)
MASVPGRKILLADDDRVSVIVLQKLVTTMGYVPVIASDGATALRHLLAADGPKLALIDWMMPEMDGLNVCRMLRQQQDPGYRYVILLTARTEKAHVAEGMQAGADDFVTKPYHPGELETRILAGERILQLQETLATKVNELETALSEVKTLRGLIPICMFCKKIKDDEKSWQKMEHYIESHTSAHFSHSLCEPCFNQHYPEKKPA